MSGLRSTPESGHAFRLRMRAGPIAGAGPLGKGARLPLPRGGGAVGGELLAPRSLTSPNAGSRDVTSP